MVVNVDQVHNLKSVLLVREEEQLILDKDLCKFKWDVVPAVEREWSTKVHAIIVEEVDWPIEHRLNKLIFQKA